MEPRQRKVRSSVFVIALLLSGSSFVLALLPAREATAQSTTVTLVCSPAGTQSNPLVVGTQSMCSATVTGQSTPGPTGDVAWGTGLGAAEYTGFSSTTCTLSGGVCSVTYTVPSCPPACKSVVIYGTYQGDANNLAGTGTFTLFVSSSSSTSSSSSSSSSSTGSSPPSVSLTVPPVKVDYGWSAHFIADVKNVPSGSPYTIDWSAGPGTPACGTPPLQSSSSDNFTTQPLTPSQTPSTFTFCALLDAGTLGTALANATAIVYPALVGPVISVSPPTVNVGQTATLTTTTPFSGGTPPYTCQWVERNPELGRFVIYGNAFNCAATSSPTVSIGNLSAAGTLLFELQVTDNASQPMTVASPNANITIALPPTTISIGITTNDDLFWIILIGVVILGISVAVIIGLYILGYIGGDEDGDEPPQQVEIIHPPQQDKKGGADKAGPGEYQPPKTRIDEPTEDTFMGDLEAAIASTAPPEESPVPPTQAAPPPSIVSDIPPWTGTFVLPDVPSPMMSPPTPAPPIVASAPVEKGHVMCKCELSDMELGEPDLGFSGSKLTVQFSVKGKVVTNRQTGLINVGLDYHMYQEVVRPFLTGHLGYGEAKLVADKPCSLGEIRIDWESPRVERDVGYILPTLLDPPGSNWTDTWVIVSCSVHGCGNWHMEKSKGIRIYCSFVVEKGKMVAVIESLGPVPPG